MIQPIQSVEWSILYDLTRQLIQLQSDEVFNCYTTERMMQMKNARK